MKLLFVQFFVVFLIWKSSLSSGQETETDDCELDMDFTNINDALANVSCTSQVNLTGLHSTVYIIRGLVCYCGSNNSYIAKDNECIHVYNDDIIIPLLKDEFEGIIEDLYSAITPSGNGTHDQACEAIQVYIDNISNVGFACVAGALSFQGDTSNGTSVWTALSTCYNNTIVQLGINYNQFLETVPGTNVTAEYLVGLVLDDMGPIIDVYDGPEFHACMHNLSGNYFEICEV